MNQAEILELRNTMKEVKDTVDASVTNSLSQKEDSPNLKIGHLKYSSQRRSRKKVTKGKNTYRIYVIPAKEPIYAL